MNSALHELTQGTIELARIYLAEGKELSHMFILINLAKREVKSIVALYNDDLQKDVVSQNIRDEVKRFNADAIISAVEGWSLEPKDTLNYQAIIQKYGSISNYPDKIEVVSFFVETGDGVWAGIEKIGSSSYSL